MYLKCSSSKNKQQSIDDSHKNQLKKLTNENYYFNPSCGPKKFNGNHGYCNKLEIHLKIL